MRHYNFINAIDKTNGNNWYHLSICHHTFDELHEIYGIGLTKEYFEVHYSWKNAKRSMNNLTLKATRTLEESIKLLEKKCKELEEKIK